MSSDSPSWWSFPGHFGYRNSCVQPIFFTNLFIYVLEAYFAQIWLGRVYAIQLQKNVVHRSVWMLCYNVGQNYFNEPWHFSNWVVITMVSLKSHTTLNSRFRCWTFVASKLTLVFYNNILCSCTYTYYKCFYEFTEPQQQSFI